MPNAILRDNNHLWKVPKGTLTDLVDAKFNLKKTQYPLKSS